MKRRLVPLAVAGCALAGVAVAATTAPISPARLSAIVETLASDAFGGRAPGSAGE